MDSYQMFLDHFNIDKAAFFEWGISATVFPSVEIVAKEWDALKKRILNNKTVYIRGYGRDAHGTVLYKELYKWLFGNSHIEKDPTNNAVPHKVIQRVTGLKRNKDILNYQVSYIWGHTKNPLMFEAPWNMCYTPKIMDPFTGHETKGIWPAEYQRFFLAKAYDIYKPFIEDYNSFLEKFNVESCLEEFCATLENSVDEKMLKQFQKDARGELAPIRILDCDVE